MVATKILAEVWVYEGLVDAWYFYWAGVSGLDVPVHVWFWGAACVWFECEIHEAAGIDNLSTKGLLDSNL